MLHYKPPKELRSLFIVHYSPLLLTILTGPLTAIYGIWEIPTEKIISITAGIIVFLIGRDYRISNRGICLFQMGDILA